MQIFNKEQVLKIIEIAGSLDNPDAWKRVRTYVNSGVFEQLDGKRFLSAGVVYVVTNRGLFYTTYKSECDGKEWKLPNNSFDSLFKDSQDYGIKPEEITTEFKERFTKKTIWDLLFPSYKSKKLLGMYIIEFSISLLFTFSIGGMFYESKHLPFLFFFLFCIFAACVLIGIVQIVNKLK
jgi:hypothetical protein